MNSKSSERKAGIKKKIEKLTPEQEARLPFYREKWISIGLATGATDERAAEAAMDLVYTCAGLKPPAQKIWRDSPRAGAQEAARLTGSNNVSGEIYNAGYGSQDADWLSFYDFFLNEVPEVTGIEKIRGLIEYAKLGGWFWPMQDVVVLTHRPIEIHMNKGRLHKDLGPAILYRDGFSVYALNGVRFVGEKERKFILLKPEELDIQEILNIKNVDQRREVLKKYGVKRAFSKLNPKLLDQTAVYKLHQIEWGNREGFRTYLEMINPSTAEIHVEAVHPDCKTVDQALAYRNNGTISVPFVTPGQLT